MIKLPRSLHRQIMADLQRRHPFAGERIGFLLCRHLSVGSKKVFLGFDYRPVRDSDYIMDETVGARVNGNAIRMAMGLAIEHGCSVFHVHTHGSLSVPMPSGTDRAECPGIARSIHNAFPHAPHGWLILGQEGVFAEIHAADSTLSRFGGMCLVGLPLFTPLKRPLAKGNLWRGRLPKSSERYGRQGFLGPEATKRIANTRVGVVGLGGGGSHVVQQLAHLGFQRYVLCDPDRVECSNLNRLAGATEQDARRRRLKVEVASRQVKALHAISEIRAHPDRWQACMRDIAECDLVIGCLDSFEQRDALEAHCRRHYIPYVDIGMEVRGGERGRHEIYGQVVLSLPGNACLQCANVVTEETLGREVQDYGQAGPQPQVIWPNGVLASTAVGHCVSLVTGWSPIISLPVRLDYVGSSGCLVESEIWMSLRSIRCPHYPLGQAGDPIFHSI